MRVLAWNGFMQMIVKTQYMFILEKENKEDQILVILNLSSVPYKNFRIALPEMSDWEPVINSDDKEYWGSGKTIKNFKTKKCTALW